MKILEAGKKREWWAGKVGECNNCGTKVQVEAHDMVQEMFDRSDELASVECPNCKNRIWVYPSSPNA
jgi:DNA-directed RNA polymerase subunit RPC12/RpoP